MRVSKKQIDKQMQGSIEMTPEFPDDIYALYNIVDEGDKIKSQTQRKVSFDNKSQQRINLMLEIVVETISVDLQYNTILFKGKTVTENEHVRLGSYHSISITLNSTFKLTKKEWNLLSLKTLKDVQKQNTEIIFVMLNEKNAILFSVTQNFIKITIRLEIKNKNYSKLLNTISKMNIESIKVIVIIGFYESRNDLFNIISNNKDMKEYIGKFCNIKLNNEYKKMNDIKIIEKVMMDPVLSRRLQDVQFVGDLKKMEIFLTLFMNEQAYTCVGANEVEEGLEYGAIKTLLLTNETFKSHNVEKRKKINSLVENTKRMGGEVCIIPSLHSFGIKLSEMGGMCAILKFPFKDS